MPRIVDHESRRADIAAALLRVVARDGLAAASVRSVAAEGDWSPGAVRHYFSTQAELLVFAMRAITARVVDRLELLAPQVDEIDGLVRFIEAIMPVDTVRLAESRVWLAMVAAAQTDESLQPLSIEAHVGLLRVADGVVGNIAERHGVELALQTRHDEAELLHAALDGLALHATLHPDRLDPESLRSALGRVLHHLENRLVASR